MTTDRREFVRLTALAGSALAVGVVPQANALVRPFQSQRRGLRILFLGGTNFIGPHMVEHATARGHTVTLFNRGRTNPGLFPRAEKLTGDRTGDVSALQGRMWDVVVDPSATQPDWVERTGRVLQGNVGQCMRASLPLRSAVDPG